MGVCFHTGCFETLLELGDRDEARHLRIFAAIDELRSRADENSALIGSGGSTSVEGFQIDYCFSDKNLEILSLRECAAVA